MCVSILFVIFVQNIFHYDKYLMRCAPDRQKNVCLHLIDQYFCQVLTKTGMGLQNWGKTANIKFDEHMFCGSWTVICWHMDMAKLVHIFLQLLVTTFHQQQKGILQFRICMFTNTITIAQCEKSDKTLPGG